jgi:hypothetical protein
MRSVKPMNHCENAQLLNCIILEIELLKKYIKELEIKVKELEKNDK